MSTEQALPEAAVRASDGEREAHAEKLRDHAAAGRLSVDELSERLEVAYAARTRGELAAVLADLPPAPRRRDAGSARRELHGHARAYLLVNTMLIAIWAITGAGYFWPIWPLLGWGVGLASHALPLAFGRTPHGGCGHRRPRATADLST